MDGAPSKVCLLHPFHILPYSVLSTRTFFESFSISGGLTRSTIKSCQWTDGYYYCTSRWFDARPSPRHYSLRWFGRSVRKLWRNFTLGLYPGVKVSVVRQSKFPLVRRLRTGEVARRLRGEGLLSSSTNSRLPDRTVVDAPPPSSPNKDPVRSPRTVGDLGARPPPPPSLKMEGRVSVLQLNLETTPSHNCARRNLPFGHPGPYS